MKPEELLRALGEINPEYIEEAEEVRHKKKNYRKLMEIAACLALVVLVGGVIKLHGENGDKGTSSQRHPQETAECNKTEKETESETSKDSAIVDGNKTMENIPDTIYVGKDCYKRIEESITYQKESLDFMGTLGDVQSKLHAEGECMGSKVYKIDSVRIMVEIDGKDYTYKK